MQVNQGQTTTYESAVDVCCHRVIYRYWDIEPYDEETEEIAAEYFHEDGELTDDLKRELDEAAENRARDCIFNDYTSGELCVLIGGDWEVRGWWEIDSDA